MTAKELSQLYYLNREIEMLQKKLTDLEARASSPAGPNLTGMPSGKGFTDNRVARFAAEIVDLQAIIAAKQIQCIHERNRLERWIIDIPDSLLRQIFSLRYISGLPWLQVALHIGGNNTADSVRMQHNRYLEQHCEKD